MLPLIACVLALGQDAFRVSPQVLRPITVKSLDRAALRKLVLEAKAGSDVGNSLSLSADHLTESGRADLAIDGSLHLTAEPNHLLVGMGYHQPLRLTLELQKLKKGKSYLIVVNANRYSGTNAFYAQFMRFSDLKTIQKVSIPSTGEMHPSLVYKAEDKTAKMVIFFDDAKFTEGGGGAQMVFSSLEVHEIS